MSDKFSSVTMAMIESFLSSLENSMVDRWRNHSARHSDRRLRVQSLPWTLAMTTSGGAKYE